jgi:transcription-repair coupling factor (superfamily II helicase)
VGFGKTEVAVRAAFKAVQDARQVVVLCPTTVLAEQHFNTFSNRLTPFPVRVEMLSRFQQKKDQKKVIEDVNKGLVDIVVGTHRVLSKDVKFKELGLLIIDEEHRFGVKQKEKIKNLKKNIDVLLLSATPIPRTLSLALSNLRDLSVIETPPYGRLPIETHLGPYDEKIVQRIIQAELSRGGQVFYVHNRVETIFSRAQYLQKLIPEIRWGVIHGQLPAQEIEKVMWQFLHRQIDVLIATTIIESGLDIPTVNTMIVEEAENFGLAQLYQLRGRIGRERQKAYCYLFYTPDKLTEESRKRLEALQEFSELGSGFRLALRDLEIRGAGNILSARQHGFVRDIGFELYSRLLDEASRRLKGVEVGDVFEESRKTVIDLTLPAFLPQEYVEAEDLRVMFYRRLGTARTPADLRAVRDELEDRFGRLPAAADNLLVLADLRLAAEAVRVQSIVEDARDIVIRFGNGIEFMPDKILALANDYAGVLEFLRGDEPGVRLRKECIVPPGKESAGPVIACIREFLSRLGKYAIIQKGFPAGRRGAS